MCFYKRPTSGQVTAEPSPRSPGLLPRRVRAWIDGVLDLAQDVSHAIDAFAGIARYAVEQVDRSVPPEAPEASESEPRSTGPAAVDLGLALRVSELERAVEALAPVPVVERRRSNSPCCVCGGGVLLVLDGAPANGDWINGLCAGCRTLASARADSEVIP